MKKTILQMKDVIVLDKSFQKKIYGGKICTYSWQDNKGNWHTESGTCAVDRHASTYLMELWNNSLGAIFYDAGTPYCRTESHTGATELTSNGGKSRC